MGAQLISDMAELLQKFITVENTMVTCEKNSAKMKNIKEAIKAHEGQWVELTLENGRKREKNKIGRLTEVYPSLFIVEYQDFGSQADAINNSYVESYTYSDILTEKTLIRYLSPEEQAEIENK